MFLPSSAAADHGTDAAKQAAVEIQAARDKANAASQAMFDAESDIDGLDIVIAATEGELAELETRAAEMRNGLEEQAVRSFVGAGDEFPLLIDFGEINYSLTADVMSAVTREVAYVDLDEYDALIPTELARYAAVIHLRTPTPDRGYDHSNPLRVEDPEQARDIDGRIERAWSNHPNRTIIDSTPDFPTKAAHALLAIGAELPDCCNPVR